MAIFTTIGTVAVSNTLTLTWNTTTSLPESRASHDSVVYNGRIYVTGGGGWKTSVFFTTINADGTIGSWTSTTPLPEGRGVHTSVAYNDYLYIIAGNGPRPPSRVERNTVWYAPINSDGSLGAWSATTSLPDKVQGHTTVLNGNKIYVLGGWTGYSWWNRVYFAEIQSDGRLSSWTATTSMPSPLNYHKATTFGNFIYVSGGVYPYTTRNIVYFAEIQSDGTINSWASTSSMPRAVFDHSMNVLDEELYVIGGRHMDGTQYNNVIRAPINVDGSIGGWVEDTPLPENHHVHTSEAHQGCLYVLGGHDGVNQLDTVYYSTRPGAYSMKNEALDAVGTMLQIDAGDSDLRDVMDYLHMSLGDARGQELGSEVIWIDEVHIDEEKGADVFQYEQAAIDKLVAYLQNDDNSGFAFEDEITAILETLYHADKMLTEQAIEDAVNADGDTDNIAVANELLVEAIDYWDTDDINVRTDNTYDCLEEAWEKAVDSY